jgi:Flp pilus assembly protein TadG
MRAESGTSMIEFAILAPVIIFLLVGTIEIGRFAYFAILAANAARAGAQYGAQDLISAYDDADITSAAIQDGQNLPNWTSNGGSIKVNQLCAVSGGAPSTCESGAGTGPPTNTIYYVQVQVTGVFNTLLNYPGIPNGLHISGSSMMRVATQ